MKTVKLLLFACFVLWVAYTPLTSWLYELSWFDAALASLVYVLVAPIIYFLVFFSIHLRRELYARWIFYEQTKEWPPFTRDVEEWGALEAIARQHADSLAHRLGEARAIDLVSSNENTEQYEALMAQSLREFINACDVLGIFVADFETFEDMAEGYRSSGGPPDPKAGKVLLFRKRKF
jgi:hypothetical protein